MSSKPACLTRSRYSCSGKAPETHSAQPDTDSRTPGTGAPRTTSFTSSRPPALRARKASPNTCAFILGQVDHAVGNHDVNLPSSTGMPSAKPWRNFTLVKPPFSAAAGGRARSMAGVISTPITRPKSQPCGQPGKASIPPPLTDIQDHFARLEIRHRRGVAAAQGNFCGFGEFSASLPDCSRHRRSHHHQELPPWKSYPGEQQLRWDAAALIEQRASGRHAASCPAHSGGRRRALCRPRQKC